MSRNSVIFKINLLFLCLIVLSNLFFPTRSLSAQNNLENGNTIIINEVMPDPAGNDSLYEWIELYNFGELFVDISNYKLNNKAIPSFLMQPDSFLILARNKNALVSIYPEIEDFVVEVSMSLPNTGGNIILSTPDYEDSISYPRATEGYSFERGGPLCFDFLRGNPSSILEENFHINLDCFPEVDQTPVTTPTILITDSISPSPSTTVSPTILNTPLPSATLTPTPNSSPIPSTTATPVPTSTPLISTTPLITPSITTLTTPTPTEKLDLRLNQSNIIITEIYPSPSSGNSEWIEIFNSGTSSVDLKGMYFRDRSSSGNSYGNTKSFLPEIVLEAGMYFVIENPKISLNNSGDEIWLFSFTNDIVDNVVYDKTDSTMSNIRIFEEGKYKIDYFDLNDDNFLPQSIEITKGSQNILKLKSVATPTPTKPKVSTTPTKSTVPPKNENNSVQSSILGVNIDSSDFNDLNTNQISTYFFTKKRLNSPIWSVFLAILLACCLIWVIIFNRYSDYILKYAKKIGRMAISAKKEEKYF